MRNLIHNSEKAEEYSLLVKQKRTLGTWTCIPIFCSTKELTSSRFNKQEKRGIAANLYFPLHHHNPHY